MIQVPVGLASTLISQPKDSSRSNFTVWRSATSARSTGSSMKRRGFLFSVKKRSKVNLTSSATSSWLLRGGLLCQCTPFPQMEDFGRVVQFLLSLRRGWLRDERARPNLWTQLMSDQLVIDEARRVIRPDVKRETGLKVRCVTLLRPGFRPRSSRLQTHILEGCGPGVGVDQHQRRFLHPRPDPTRPDV
jgi:hypothetical protein